MASQSGKKQKIALVDDDQNIVTSLTLFLQNEGFEVTGFADGSAALTALTGDIASDGIASDGGAASDAGGGYDIGVFDIKMPRMDGLELLRRLREKSDMPVIFLTSKDDEIDELVGLKIGADDYITKPFSQKLLVTRIRTILRRTELREKRDTGTTNEQDGFMQRGNLTLDTARHECLWGGQQINLTVTEFLILESLVTRPGYVKSRDALMDAAYDDQVYVDDRTIDSHIKRLRRKFRQKDKAFDAIETLYGVGYRFKET